MYILNTQLQQTVEECQEIHSKHEVEVNKNAKIAFYNLPDRHLLHYMKKIFFSHCQG